MITSNTKPRNKHLPIPKYKHRFSNQISKSDSQIGWVKVLLVIIVIGWFLTFSVGFSSVLTFFNVLGLILVVVGLKNKNLGLLGIAFLCTLDAMTRSFLLTGGLWRWNTLNYWLLIVILLNIPLLLKFHDLQTRLFQIFVVLMIIMLSISLDLTSGMQSILNTITMFGIMIYFSKTIKEKETWYWTGIFCGVTAAVGGAVFYFQIASLPYINPNSFSQFPLTALFAICLAIPVSNQIKKGRFLLLFLMVINLIWVILSGSRGSMLSGFICLIYFVIIMRSFSWTSGLIIVGLIALYWFSNILIDQQVYALHRIQKLFDQSYTLNERTSGRADIYWTGWQLFLRQPLGIGTGSFEEGANYLQIIGGKDRPAHSAWNMVLAENGFLGFLLLFSWVISFVIKGILNSSNDDFSVGLLVTLVLGISFVSKEFQGKDLWYLASGAMVQLNAEQVNKIFDQAPHLFGVLTKRNRKRKILENG